MPRTRRAGQAPAIIFAIGVFTLGPGLLQPAHGQAKNTPFGVLLTPAHLPAPQEADIIQALRETAQIGGHVSYMWEWSDESGFSKISTLLPLYRFFGLKVFLQVSPTGVGRPVPPSGMAPTFEDAAVRARYLSDVERLAALQPDYLNLAAEINLLYYVDTHLGTSEWTHYRSLYQEAYRRAKAISPNTQIGVSFHSDLVFGYGQSGLIDDLGPQDYIGFTTYPSWTVYKGPFYSLDKIPPAYYDRIRLLVPDKPIVYAEVGWPSGGKGTPEDQAAYIAALPRLLHSTAPVLVTWSMLHDADHFQVEWLSAEQIAVLLSFELDPVVLFDELNSMGILSWDGPPKPAWFAATGLTFDF